MPHWIALLRGINVGGHHIVPMKRLRELLAQAGFSDVRTYIQSGNCVFEADEADPTVIARSVSGAIEGEFGFRPTTFVLTVDELRDAIEANPFRDDVAEPKYMHLSFRARQSGEATKAGEADLAALAELATQGERFECTERVFYLHAPNGIGRSKVAAKLAKHVPGEMTARNLRSCLKILELANRPEP